MVKKQKKKPCNCKGKQKAINTINSVSQINKSRNIGFKKNSTFLNKLLIFLLKKIMFIILVAIAIIALPIIILLLLFKVKIRIPVKFLRLKLNNG